MSEFFLFTYVLLWVVVLVSAVLLLATLRHMAQFVSASEPLLRFKNEQTRLVPGRGVPAISVSDPRTGQPATVPAPSTASLVLVVDPTCSPCHRLLTEFGPELSSGLTLGWRTTLVLVGRAHEALRLRETYKIDSNIEILADEGGHVRDEWGITSTPAGVTVGSDGRLLRVFAAVDVRALRSLFTRIPIEATAHSEPPVLATGGRS